MSPSRSSYPVWLFATLCMFVLALLVYPAVTTSAEQDGLQAAWGRALEAGAYDFTADVEQTLIPRSLPSMIGQTSERVDMRIEGDVTLPDQMRMELRFEGGRFDAPPLTLVREGAETYLLKDGERIPIENPAGLTSPTSDYLSYLAAAENVQQLPSPDGGGAGGGGERLTHYSYDINGPRFAEHVREQMEAQLEGAPAGVELSPSPLLQRMSGRGELWVDADGLPRRQVVDLEIPEASEEYDAQAHIVVDFRFDEEARERVALGSQTSEVFRNLRGLEVDVRPTDLSWFFLSVVMASVLIGFRRRRWVYGLVAVSVSIIMVSSPLLQAVGIVRFQERQAQAAPAETVAAAFGLEPSAIGSQPATRNLQPATHPAAPSDYEPNLMCGEGDPSADSDGDGMNDADENCLGTDPEHADSDRDMITDTLELDGFSSGGSDWTGDPFNPDSNRDGLSDLAEWPEPVGAAPDLDVADDWDPDADGAPNLWDADNDGDEVPDSLDLSPFARTAYSDSFSLTTQGSDFDGYQYIELQVQPEETSHLRYSTTYLDWPYDERGQIQDLDDSTEDINLYPILKIHTNQPPDEDLARTYGVSVFEDDGEYDLYITPVPVSDGGRIVAFYVKVAYGPDELDDIRWENVELLWMARMSMDQQAGDEIKTSVVPLHTYLEESFRVTGLQITKSRNFESMILGTPDSPNDDRWIFNLLFGLSSTFLTHQDPDLQEIEFRFSSPNTLLKKTWGVTSTLVTVELPSTPYGHVDEGLEDLPVRVQDFLEHNYPADSNSSLAIATQEEVGMYSLDDQGQFEPESNLNLNLADVAMSTRRGLRSNIYESEDDTWSSLDLQETLDLVQERYEDELADIVTQLENEYPELTTEDLELLLDMFYIAWFVGQMRILSLDGQALAPDGRDDQEVYDELHQDADSLPAYLLEAANLGEPGGGLKIGDSPTQYWEYQRDQEDKGIELGVVYPTWVKAGIVVGVVLRTVLGLRTAIQATRFAGAVGFATRMKILSDNAGQGSRVLGVVGLVVSILAIWTIFFITAGLTGWDWDSPTVKQAAIFATVATIITAILFAISLNPVGAIVVGILAFLDLILFAVSLGEFSITTAIIEWITGLIYDAHVLTTFEDASFEDFDTAVMDEEMGLVVGNRFRVSDRFVGAIERTSDGDNDDLEDSWVDAHYHGSATAAAWANKNSGKDCHRSGSTLTCENDVAVEFRLDTSKRNVKLTVKSAIEAKTYYEECWFGDCERESQYTHLPDDLPSYDQWDPMNFYLDVLPDTVQDLFTWSDIDNPDRDGDGLLNDEEEDSLGTDPDKWDTDDDGLADKFEVDSQETLGTDPAKADTDDDGLLDGLEYRIGTGISAADSDDDGLTDGEEVFHQEGSDWVGGWLVELPSGETALVFSDPLVADADGDRLNDRSERSETVSPYGYNDTPELTLKARPLAQSPGGATAVYVVPGEKVTMDLTLDNTGPRFVTSTLTLCLPDFFENFEGGDMQGDSTPSKQAAACNGFQWSFASDELLPGEAVNTIVTATVSIALSSSTSEEISATLPYMVGDEEEDIIDQATVVVDLDDPEVSITAPLSGTLLGGGISHYVVGGAASDESSWVTGVEVDLPAGAGTVDAEGVSPWAYTWELPDDGVYTLAARSYDYVDHTSLIATVVVAVDNTAPTATLALENGAVVTGTTGKAITITLSGDAGDNLSGLTRVQVSTDGRPWREVWASGGQTILSANWSTEWVLPSEASAQGKHTVKVRALDRAGNESDLLLRTIIVDVAPPTSELTDRTYLADPPPHIQTDEELALYGVANDAGNVPAPSRPAELVGDLDSIEDATIWLEMSSIDDDNSGVGVAWLGDFNGDRLADLVVGLPSAEGEAGRVTIVYGRAGGWPVPSDAELLADSLSSLVGKAGAKIGDAIGPAGDVDGDGFSDLLVGDSKNSRVYVVFGHPGPLGRDLVLEGPRYPYWSVIDLTGLGDLSGLSAAGDVNGDGFDDLLVGATGAEGKTYLLLGEVAPWWEIVPLDVKAEVEIATDPDGAYLSGVGDMDGDEYDEFVIAEGNTVYLFEGQAVLEESLELSDAIAMFLSSEARPQVAALGDTNGDDLSDFIYSGGDSPTVVFGDENRDWSTQPLDDLAPAPSGFLAAPGDVDYDGLGDILVQNEDGDADLILGKNLSEVKATLTGVQAAASAPYAAGADLNSDGSSDLLLVPSVLGGSRMSAVEYGPLPHVDPDDLPVMRVGESATRSVRGGASPLRPVANHTVDDDGDADFASIQAAVDAAGPGDHIYVAPGVYDSFTVTVNNLYIWGDHADAVFVDGGGGDFAVKIQGADGVKLKRLTLRNADAGVVLDDAGVGGYEDEEKKIALERVLIYDVDSHAVKMDRVSSARLTRCTLAGREDHIDVYGAPDPAMDESWSEVSTDSRTATSANGGMFDDGGKLYFVDDSGQINVYNLDTAAWSSLPDAPAGIHAGVAVDENGHLWALRRDLDTGFDGPVYAIAYVSQDEIYVGGDFRHVGDVAVNYIARWDGSAWEEVGSGFAAPDDTVYDIKVNGTKIYAGGAFGLRYLPDKDNPYSLWDNWGDISGGGAVYAMTLHSGGVFVGGAFDDIGGVKAHKLAKREANGAWSQIADPPSDSCNGILASGYHVSTLANKGGIVYLGGRFHEVGAKASGSGCSSPAEYGLAKTNGSYSYGYWIAGTPRKSDLKNGSDIYAFEFYGDSLAVGGKFNNVKCYYEDGYYDGWWPDSSYCSATGAASNLAIFANKEWQAPGYLKANAPVRTLQIAGDRLYIGGDFTQVGDGAAANHVAYYDSFPGGGGSWHALGSGVNDSVHALVHQDGHTYIGGSFTLVEGNAVFHFAHWNGSQWIGLSEQAFYEYNGSSWQARSVLPEFVGAGSAIVSDGDGSLYAVPGSGSRELYRYTISSDSWDERASLPDGLGAGGALAFVRWLMPPHDTGADGYLYALRGGGTDDFYRYDPGANKWSTLALLPWVVGAGGALTWDGWNWLYAVVGGNGEYFLRYCIPEDRWEVLDDALAEIKAGGGLVRIGRNLYGVPGGDEKLWSYDPVAVYPEKLTLDHVAVVVPETVSAADWISLTSVIVPPDDFVVGGTGNAWIGGSGVAWSPEPLLDDSAQITHDNARFLDVERDVYRVGSGTLLDAGYHTYRVDYTVEPCEGIECTSPNPIQTGINSGANRVLLEPGVYEEGFYLISGVEVIGDGADLTIVEPSEFDTVIVRAEGVVGARLSMLTLHGADSGVAVAGLFVEDGTRSVVVDHTIIRGANVGISTTGKTTELEVVNNTIVSNTNGMVAADCAPVDVRNTIFAYHSDTGLTYDGCAERKLHKYNLYWENTTNISSGNPGPAELFLDPLFVDSGPPSHDYHTENESPVIDAGDPGDPPPPGAGDRVDIGYIDQNRAGLYVSGDYCETCVNDGLSWQVDAFDKIQDALNKADENIRELEGWRYTVAVAAGTYTETLTVPSYVRLVGDGAEETIINADGASVPVTCDGVVQAEIDGFTIEGCPATAAISVTGASNGVTITRNIIEDCDDGIVFSERASGLVSFNTLVNNHRSIFSTGPGSWVALENNILYHPINCEGGLWVDDSGQIFSDYNLRSSSAYEVGYCTNVDIGPNEICDQEPDFAPGGYCLQDDSPVRDAASPFVEAPPGGGERADMGYYELVADPITLFLGREDVSSATGNSGMSEVEVGFSRVSDPDDPVTATVPGETDWMTVTLDTPGETVSYWQTAFTPTHESLYRFYSRAADVAGNREEGGEIWYDGAFVADSVSPVVTWTQPTAPNVSSPLELRAEVYDYATDEFSVENFYFVVDGARREAEWAADPWDEESKEPRTFRAWVSLGVGAHDAHAVAEDRAGNQGLSASVAFTVSGQSLAGTTPPDLVVASPPDDSWYTSTVVFSGTVTDAESGIAAVEVSLDGGYTWLPATVDGADWELTWEAPEEQEFISYPARVRARDQAGDTAIVSRTFSIDNVPPDGPHVEEFTAIFAGLEKEAPPGTHFDTPVDLRITWRPPFDGSGVATTWIAVDQAADTSPAEHLGVLTTTTRSLSTPGDWYVHLAVEDGVGNRFTRHYGSWHVGTFSDLSTTFLNKAQTIVVDGEMGVDQALEEWHDFGWEWGLFELMDDFKRGDFGELSKPRTVEWWDPQRFFVTWDGTDLYLGWSGAWWTLDGELWIYLNLGGGGCTVPSPFTPGGPACSELPFAADYAVNITGSDATDGMLWKCNEQNLSWEPLPGVDWEFSQGDGGGTEIRLNWLDMLQLPPVSLGLPSDLGMIAFALDDKGEPWAVFPTTNSLTDPCLCRDAYTWENLASILEPIPNDGQPQAAQVLMSLDSPQAPGMNWCPGSTLEYVISLNNLEERLPEPGDVVVLDASAGDGLGFVFVEGADCPDCPPLGDWWTLSVPLFSPGDSHTITLTGVLTDDLSGIPQIDVSVALKDPDDPDPDPEPGPCDVQASISHLLDSQPPSVTISTDPDKAIRPILGAADDGDGSGVALVEYQINDDGWQAASGTLFWSADIELPQATTWQVQARSQDRCGRYSAITTVEFSDSIPPTTTLETRFLETDLPDLEGTASDLPTGGEVISVEVRIDDETAAWQPASVGAPDTGGVQDWQFTWSSSWDGVTHTVWIRAADVTGNVGQAGPFEVYVAQGEMVGGHTELATTRRLLWPRVAFLVAVVVIEIAMSMVLKKRRK